MPSTLNGIGTHYYGRSKVAVRTAPCRSCRRVGNLTSYDTRLWFVVVFVPIIPLGRKRILDQCPSCTRHLVMKADAYEQAKQAQISATLEQFGREPSPASAIEAHAQLLAFHEHDQAAGFRGTALARFPANASLRAGLAAQLWEMSSFDEAAKLYQEALHLDSDLPEARIGVAHSLMAQGELDEAQDLLDFLMEPGAGQQYSLTPIDLLSGHFQRADRHEEAMRIAEVLLRELPKLEDNHTFRAFVKRTEKALGRIESILPERKASLGGLFRSEGSPYAPWQRKLAIGGLAAILVLGGLAISNEFIRRHRTVHVLNATGQSAQVQVDNEPAVPIMGLGHLTVPEGPHVIKVSGPVNETHDIAVDSGYFQRWFNQPAWVVNLNGEGVLEEVTHVYSTKGTPSQRRLVVGEKFFGSPHVDYVFTNAPGDMKLKNQNDEITKTSIGWVQADDFNAFMETIEVNRKVAMEFAEKRLRRNPHQGDLLKYYIGFSDDTERGPMEAFLKSELDRRPVDIQWHRAYQAVAELNKHNTELMVLYDKYLAADPSNAALLYLRGRIEPDWDKQAPYYSRSIESDPKLGWPWMAIAARGNSEGRWDDALAAALKARALNVDEPERIAELIHDARMAKGDAKSLVEEYRARSNGNPQDFSAVLYLIEALAAAGRPAEIDPAIAAWNARLPSPVQGQIAPHLTAWGLYYAGRLKECAKFCSSTGLAKSSPAHLHSLIALGRMKEATDDPIFAPLWNDPLNLLAVSVGFSLAGKPDDATAWREKALSRWSKVASSTDFAKAATLLSAPEPPAIKELLHFYLPPVNKAVLLAALANRFPARRAAYLAQAARFNIGRKPSYYLIKQATEKTATAAKP